MKRLLSILSVFIVSQSYAQIPSVFHTRFGGNENDIGNCIIQARNGGYIVIGETNSFGVSQTDVYISRTDSSAQCIWQKGIGGVLSEIGKSCVELSDSSIVVAGYTNSYGNGGYDAYIFRVDKNGNLIWQQTFGGNDWDFAYSICKTTDGNLVVCGETYSFGYGTKDGFILKLDYNGNFLWNKVYGGSKEDGLKEIIQTNDGGYIATGTTKSYGDSLGDIWITKFDNLGDSVWFKTRGGNKMEVGNSIIQNSNNDYFIAGGSETYGSGKEDAYVFKVDLNGNFLWEGFEGLATEDEEAFSIKNSIAVPGGIVFCFTTKELSGFKKDSKTLLYDASGVYLNGGRVGSLEDDEVYSVANCVDKGYIVAGYTEGFNSFFGKKDIFIVKFDSLMNGPGSFILGVSENYDLKNSNVKIYPNPFVDKITVKTQVMNPISKVEIVDLTGIVVFSDKYSNVHEISIADLGLNSGIFILKITTKLDIHSIKIVCSK